MKPEMERWRRFAKYCGRAAFVTLLVFFCTALAQAKDEPIKTAAKKNVLGPKRLDQPTSVGGYLCVAYLWTWDDGSLNQCRLGVDSKIGGLEIPKDSTVFFYRGGQHPSHVWLSRPLTIQGVPCSGGKNSKIDTAFYESGKLRAAFISKPLTIQGLAIKQSVFCPLYLYETGKVKECTIERELEIDGKKYPKNTTVKLDEQGKVNQATPAPSKLQILGGIFKRNPKKNESKYRGNKFLIPTSLPLSNDG